MNPSRGVREDARRRGDAVKDHHADNIRRLAEIQEAIAMGKEMEAAHSAVPKFAMRQFRDVPSKVTRYMGKGSDAEENGPSPRTTAPRSKTAAAAAVPARYTRPEVVSRKPAVPSTKDLLEAAARAAPETPPKDHVSGNIRSVLEAAPPASPRSPSAAGVKHPEYGAVPAYLRERQAEWAAAAAAKKRAEDEADVPRGMRLMPEGERLDTLSLIAASMEETRLLLSKFKLTTDVPSQLRRRAELEAKLTKLEDAQRVFSKTRVFVKIDG